MLKSVFLAHALTVGIVWSVTAAEGSCIIDPGSAVHVSYPSPGQGVALTTFAAHPAVSSAGSLEMRHRTSAASSGSSFDSHKSGMVIIVK